MSSKKYGYAAAPEPDSLQAQVEALEDAKIPIERQFAEIVNPGHPERPQFNALLKCTQPGDIITIETVSAIGSDLLDAFERANIIEEKGVKIEILNLDGWASQKSMIAAFRYFGDLFKIEKSHIPSAGKPRNPYPPGWREAYRKYMDDESTAAEICEQLGIPLYAFYRLCDYYKAMLKARKKGTKKQ